ncbi:MAG: hypothetical protein AAGA48_21750 [Myxococcota bacterium]
MSASDVLSLVALLVSLFTWYWTSLRQSVTAPKPRFVGFSRDSEGNWFMGATLTIINRGSTMLAVDFLDVEAKTKQGKFLFNCYSDSESLNEHVSREDVRPDQRKMPHPFVLQPGTSTVKHAVFIARNGAQLAEGKFVLTFRAALMGRRRPRKLTRIRVRFEGELSPTETLHVASFRTLDQLTFDFRE